jgi:hypothetical protein
MPLSCGCSASESVRRPSARVHSWSDARCASTSPSPIFPSIHFWLPPSPTRGTSTPRRFTWSKTPSSVTHRDFGQTLNNAILYQMQAHELANRLRVDTRVARNVLKAYQTRAPAALRYIAGHDGHRSPDPRSRHPGRGPQDLSPVVQPIPRGLHRQGHLASPELRHHRRVGQV